MKEPFFGASYKMRDTETAMTPEQLARDYATIRMAVKAGRVIKAARAP